MTSQNAPGRAGILAQIDAAGQKRQGQFKEMSTHPYGIGIRARQISTFHILGDRFLYL